MKKLMYNLPLLIFLIVDVFVNILVFAFTPGEIIGTANFWISWVFAFPVSYALMAFLTWYIRKDEKTRLLALNAFGSAYFSFDIVYLVLFFFCAYVLRDKLTVVTIILELLATSIFAVLIIKWLFPVSYLQEVNKKQEAVMQEKKMSYLPEISSMVNSAIAMTDNAEVKAKLLTLATQIASSTPNSPDRALVVESELKAIVYQINQFITINNYDDIDTLIRQAMGKLAERNNICVVHSSR